MNSGDPDEAQRYIAENDLPTHPDIAYCPKSIPLVVAEAFLQARDRVPRLGELEFDVRHLCRVALRDVSAENYPAVRDAVTKTANWHQLKLAVPPSPTLAQKIDREVDRMRVRVRRLREGYRRIAVDRHGVDDVAGAGRLAYDLLSA